MTALLSGWGTRLALLAAALGAVLAVLVGARQSGRAAERVAALRSTVESINAQRHAAAAAPADRPAVIARLRDGNF